MKKLAIVNQPLDGVIPPNHTSIGIWTFNVAPFLAQQFDVTVYARWRPSQRSWKREDHLRYQFVRSLPKRVVDRLESGLTLVKDKKLPVFASRSYYLDYIVPVAIHLRWKRADIVHVHNFTQFVPIIRAFNPQAKIVLHMGGEWLTQLDADVMARRASMCALIFGASDHLTNLIRARFPQFAERCHTVYNGVDAELFGAVTENRNCLDDPRLLFVGRVSPEKGVHVLIEAFSTVVKKYPNTHLDIVGPIGAMPAEYLVSLSDDPEVHNLLSLYSEPYGAYLNRQIQPSLTKNVHFVGNIPHDQLADYYHRAEILINPSFSESFGMSLVEALASERPVIATRVGGMVEIVDGGPVGILVDRGDVSSLAHAIIALLDDREKRVAMGRAGREMVLERFTWSKIANRVSNLYAGMLGSNA